RSLMDYCPETETKDVKLAYGYEEIIILTDIDVPVHDIQLEKQTGKHQREYC
ncbi:MAG: hypothetical protein EXX96DRAFT_484574, partial [Benjaminiella poitrasii]